ncbi:hypothetical protein KKF86_03050 [bacterium]|nr:hypothetical protein [bacterium]
MFHFFRKIRRKLIEKTQLKKYLFYAVGEIVLVVIGILIALQINNWNENRKLKIKELKILNELRSDLIQNMSDIESNLDGFRNSINSNKVIKYHIENQLPYHDSLDYHFFNLSALVALTLNQTTYDNLKQIGIDIISNDSLRFSISDLYGHKYPLYMEFENRYMMEHFTNNIKPIMISEFSAIGYNSLVPKNYNQLINHPQLKQIINYTIIVYAYFIRNQSDLKNRIEFLIGELDVEIEKLRQ